MAISPLGLNMIKQFEGCKLKAYKDPGTKDGIPYTVGYGSTTRPDGSSFKLGEVITQAEADNLLAWEVNKKAA